MILRVEICFVEWFFSFVGLLSQQTGSHMFFFRKQKTIEDNLLFGRFLRLFFFCYPQNFTRKKNLYTSFWGVVLKRRENGKQKMPLLSETFGEKQTCPALMKTFLIHAVYNFHYVVFIILQCCLYSVTYTYQDKIRSLL